MTLCPRPPPHAKPPPLPTGNGGGLYLYRGRLTVAAAAEQQNDQNDPDPVIAIVEQVAQAVSHNSLLQYRKMCAEDLSSQKRTPSFRKFAPSNIILCRRL